MQNKLPREVKLTGAIIKLEANGADGAPRRFEQLAYTGGEIQYFGMRVVMDLVGMRAPSQQIPILRQHDAAKIAGMSDKVEITNKDVRIQGTLSRATKTGKKIAKLADEGFPWQASVGLELETIEEIKAGVKVNLNGRTFQGPLLAVRKSNLRECSFVPMGRDGDTKSVVLSAFNEQADAGAAEVPAAEPTVADLDTMTIAEFRLCAPGVYAAVCAEVLAEAADQRAKVDQENALRVAETEASNVLRGHVQTAVAEFGQIKATFPGLKIGDYIQQYFFDFKLDASALVKEMPEYFGTENS